MSRRVRKVFRIFIYIFLFLTVVLPVIVYFALKIPAVQKFAIEKTTSIVSNKIKCKVSISNINISFPQGISLKKVYIEDKKGDTLLYANELNISINFFKIFKKEIAISKVKIDEAKVFLDRGSGQTDYNFTFIQKAFADTSQSKSTWTFDIDNVALNKLNIRYHDKPAGIDYDSYFKSLSLNIDELDLENQLLKINKIAGNELAISLNFQKPEQLPNSPPSTEENKWKVTINQLALTGSSYKYNDYTIKALPKGFDVNRMNITSINGDLRKITFATDTILFSVNSFSAKDKSGLSINELQGKLDLKSSLLSIDVSKLKTPNSDLHNELNLKIPMSKHLDFGSIAASGNFKDEVLSVKDLNYFLPELDTMKSLKNKNIAFTGDLSGKLNDVQLLKAKVSLDKDNYFEGDISVKGFPDFKTSFFDLKVKDMNLQSKLLASFIDQKAMEININHLNNIHANGSMKGSLSDLSTKLAVKTGLGNLSINGKISADKEFNLKNFNGELATSKFNLGKFLKKENEFGIVSIKTIVKGNINTLENFNAHVSEFEFKKYSYKNLNINGSIVKDRIAGDLKLNDKNLKADLKINAGLKDATYQLKGDIKHADLHQLNLTKSPLIVSTKIDADMKGSNIDSMEGNARLSNIQLSDGKQNFSLGSISLESHISGNNHSIDISSPIVQAKIEGDFRPSELPEVINYLSQKYFPLYFGKPHLENFKSSEFSFNINSGNIGQLSQIFSPDLKIVVDSIDMKGMVSLEDNTTNIYSNIGNLSIDGKSIKGLTLNITGDNDRLSFLMNGRSISLGNNMLIDQPMLSGVVKNNSIDLNLKLYDQKDPTRLNLDGVLTLGKDSLYLNFPNADIFIRGHEWMLNKNNSIVLSNKYVEVKKLELRQKEQLISVNSKGNQLEALFQKLKLEDMAELVGASSYKKKGLVNGQVNVSSNQAISGNVRVDSLYFNNQEVGNLSMKATKEANAERININIALNGNDAQINGYYDLNEENNIDLNINLARLPLQAIQPFVKDFIFRLSGVAKGNLHVSGKASNPDFTGVLRFEGRNEIGVTTTNTIYRFNDQQITFRQDAVLFDRFTFTDSLHNAAILNGSIYHKGLEQISLALNLDTDKFEFVNSTYGRDKAIYGKLLGRLHVGFSGPIEDLKITVDASTLKGTRLYIVMNNANTSAGVQPYVHFSAIEPLNPIDSNYNLKIPAVVNSSLSKLQFTKYNIDGTLKITKDAELNLIVDPVNEDKITANGEGNFTFSINSENNINLYGLYTIENGSYSFSFALLKKDFTIEKGSTINWTGDPLGATLDITGIYKARAPRYPLIQNQLDFMTKEQIDASRRLLPINVLLKLTGELLAPQIAFDIKEPEGVDPLNDYLVNTEINRIRNNPNEINKQAFSLILANRFISPDNSLLGDNGSSPGINQINRSVSSLLNSQLNKLASENIGGVDLTVDVEPLDRSFGPNANNIKVMAKRQLNSRITVGIGGNVNINNTYGTNQLAGDYNIMYRLNKKGTVNFKYFRTSFQNLYASTVYVGQGISVSYRREFERWKYIFRDPQKRKEKAKKENQGQG